jgi:hypothetical protein
MCPSVPALTAGAMADQLKGPSIMSIQIIKSGRSRRDARVHQYMQEIRDIARGGFNRRDLLKLGLVMGGAGLAALDGFRGFRPHWAHAKNGGGGREGAGGLALESPPNTPFVEPLPIPPTLTPVRLNPTPTKGTDPLASVVTGFTEISRPDHQRWEEFLPVRMYETIEAAVSHNFYVAK